MAEKAERSQRRRDDGRMRQKPSQPRSIEPAEAAESAPKPEDGRAEADDLAKGGF